MMAEPRWRLPELQAIDADVFGGLSTIYAAVEDGCYIECDVVHPPSMTGRRVTLRIPPEKADAMLKVLRDYAIDRRR